LEGLAFTFDKLERICPEEISSCSPIPEDLAHLIKAADVQKALLVQIRFSSVKMKWVKSM